MNNITVSVIVPIYNSDKYIERCINSLINQSNNNYELILVDDGSTDLSGSICDKYAHGNIKVQHNLNQGVGKTRNCALDIASGEYIAFVDSDDYVSNDYIDKLISNMESHDLLMFANCNHFEDGGETILKQKETSVVGQTDVEKYILHLKSNWWQHWEFYGYIWNKCYRRSIIEENNIRFTDGLSFREDNLFNEAYYRHTKSLKIISDVLYHYRFSTTGLTYKKVPAKDFVTIARGLDANTEGILYRPLYEYDKKRALSFLTLANYPDYSFSYRTYIETRLFVKRYSFLILQKKQILYYKYPLPIGLFAYLSFGFKRFIKRLFL